MKIIDAHIHYSNIQSFHQTANERSLVQYSKGGYEQEFAQANVVLSIAMGVTEVNQNGFPDNEAKTPMGVDLSEKKPNNVVYCLGINPYTLDQDALAAIELNAQKPEVVGLKIYLGYYPFYAYDDVYKPVYALAKKYNLPVVFHTGDTYSERGLLKYSHPLTIDEVAVIYSDITFMIAHLGDPWTLTGAEIIYKNSNVYADLSGLLVGTDKEIERLNQTNFFDHLRHAITFADSYDKLLFGTDWPLVPVGPYIEFIKTFIPVEHHEKVFYLNALKVFPKIQNFLKE
ncbi:amidohydrolase family protein [Alkalihalobacillus pseudalcaliphilus]|uniref:amidohydrolase family protein n=1 Tax=Alkalihalobacillus pseudalcaliphilus TaxID=79884 RepID=UPI00064E13C7|nr:TatD family hydrolase [Alkalihalobacillus pseudalcaliphilus]KMK74923.1 amidohydrolase [Alkalihalobacillus pseudalcaliphilus]